MKKYFKSLMGCLLIACLLFALPLSTDAKDGEVASAKASASVKKDVVEKEVTDKVTISPKTITFEPKQTKSAPEHFTGDWRQDARGWWFELDEPHEGCYYLRDAFVWIEDAEYYFDYSGYMVTGWYYNGWDWYYFDASGVLQYGWTKVSGKWYYLDEEYGYMYSDNWIYDDYDNCYYVDSNGVMLENRWLHTDGDYWYYYGAGGVEARGWYKVGGSWYYFAQYDDENYVEGTMYSSEWLWEDRDGDGYEETCYYLSSSGAMLENQWLHTAGDYWYYYGPGGVEARGWYKIGGSWYYFAQYDDERYVEGTMYCEDWLHLDENNDGDKDTWYYLGSNGVMKTGWINTDEDDDGYEETWYYQGVDGRGYTHWHKIGGSWYHFDEESGAMYPGGIWYLECEGVHAKFAESGAWLGYVY